MPRCGLYIRVSTSKQASEEEGSLKSQAQRIREEMERRSLRGEPWVEAKIYVEEGVSGKDLNRPKFIEMVQDIKAGVIDTVICTELSRISRSVIDFLNFEKFLESHKTGFICLKQAFDTTTPQGKLLVTVVASLGEFERELTADRTSENLLARAKRGLRNGSQVLGYDPDPVRKGYLVPNETEKALVNLIFDKYLELGSVEEVSRNLNASGYRTKGYTAKSSGKVHAPHRFDKQTIHYALTNRAYIGEVEVNRMNKSKNQATLPEKKRYSIAPAVWEAIVPAEKFQRVQELLRQNGQVRKSVAARVSHLFILRGLVQCGTCGMFLEDGSGTSKSGELHFYYRHKGSRHPGCTLPSLRAENLERIAINRLGYLAERQDILDDISEQANMNLENDVPKVMKLLGERKQEFARLGRELSAWTEKVVLMEAADIQDLILPKVAELKKQQSQVTGEIELLQKSLDELKGNVVSAIELREMLQSFSILYQELPPHKQRELLGAIIKSITVTPSQIEMALFGRANLERFTLKDEVFAQRQSWLPD